MEGMVDERKVPYLQHITLQIAFLTPVRVKLKANFSAAFEQFDIMDDTREIHRTKFYYS